MENIEVTSLVFCHLQEEKGKDKRIKQKVKDFLEQHPNLPQYVADKDYEKIQEELDVGLNVLFYGDSMFSRYKSKNGKKPLTVLYGVKERKFAWVSQLKGRTLFSRLGGMCKKCYKNFENVPHDCFKSCRACGTIKCVTGRNKTWGEIKLKNIHCNRCGNYFIDKDCLERHKQVKNGQSRCQSFHYCDTCMTRYKGYHQHVCGQWNCRNCKQDFSIEESETHRCYIQKIDVEKLEKSKKKSKVYYFDIEATISPKDEHGHSLHIFALAIVIDPKSKIHVFRDEDEFLDYCFSIKNGTFIAHNGGKYDITFVKANLMERGLLESDCGEVNRGGRVLKFILGTNQFIDSIHFWGENMSLRNASKAFGLDIHKTWFPYEFFSPENRYYKGPIPAIEHFKDLDEEGLLWYNSYEGEYDIDEVCEKYCLNDVKVLKQACEKFQTLFFESVCPGLDPFAYMTMGQVVLATYRAMFLPENSLCILTEDRAYNPKKIGWLLWVATEGLFSGERDVVIHGVRFDLKVDKVLYKWLPCIDTGCLECTDQHKQFHPVTSESMKNVAKRWTLIKRTSLKKIEDEGYTLVMRKECSEQDSPDIDLRNHERLVLNDAMYGGRTELFNPITDEGDIRYFDFTSLYPSVMYGQQRRICTDDEMSEYLGDDAYSVEYPIGPPTHIWKPESLDPYFGVVRCRVRLRKGRRIPVLPVRIDGKLCFPTGTFTGTWCTEEVKFAVKYAGYEILHIYDVYHFERRSSDLFAGFVKHFLKIKQEAAGWPEGVDKQEYIAEYKREMGITLENVEKNPGLYVIAKLVLNSLWGKMSQRFYPKETITVRQDEIEEHWESLISNCSFFEDGYWQIELEKKQDYLRRGPNTNILVGIFTTAHARMRLYRAILAVGEENAIYCDTDSLIFKQPAECKLLLGPYLGDMTDECARDPIVQIVTLAPKSYSLKFASGKQKTVCKGSKEKPHFDDVKQRVRDDSTEPLYVETTQFRKNAKGRMFTAKVKKKITYDSSKGKRQRVGLDTIPLHIDDIDDISSSRCDDDSMDDLINI